MIKGFIDVAEKYALLAVFTAAVSVFAYKERSAVFLLLLLIMALLAYVSIAVNKRIEIESNTRKVVRLLPEASEPVIQRISFFVKRPSLLR